MVTSQHRLRLRPLVLAAVILLAALASVIAYRSVDGAGRGIRAYTGSTPHVFVVVMENKEQSSVVGNAHAPYVNRLTKQFGYAARFYGVTHPSLPNYVASIAGNVFNVRDDSPARRFNARNLVDQLEAHGLTWRAYMDGMPRPGYTGNYYPTNHPVMYVRRHNPFMLMNDILNNARRRTQVVPAWTLTQDLRTGHVPNLAYIVPNLCSDMHGTDGPGTFCPSNDFNGLLAGGDTYLKNVLPIITASPAWTKNSMIIVFWDEGASNSGCCGSIPDAAGGNAPAIVIAREGRRAFVSHTPYNTYSVLKTMQTVWHLGCLEYTCDRRVHPMTEFLRTP